MQAGAAEAIESATLPIDLETAAVDDDLFSILDDKAEGGGDTVTGGGKLGDQISFFSDYVNQNAASKESSLFD